MTISELIERLEALKAEQGDLPVFTHAETGDMLEPDPEMDTAWVML